MPTTHESEVIAKFRQLGKEYFLECAHLSLTEAAKRFGVGSNTFKTRFSQLFPELEWKELAAASQKELEDGEYKNGRKKRRRTRDSSPPPVSTEFASHQARNHLYLEPLVKHILEFLEFHEVAHIMRVHSSWSSVAVKLGCFSLNNCFPLRAASLLSNYATSATYIHLDTIPFSQRFPMWVDALARKTNVKKLVLENMSLQDYNESHKIHFALDELVLRSCEFLNQNFLEYIVSSSTNSLHTLKLKLCNGLVHIPYKSHFCTLHTIALEEVTIDTDLYDILHSATSLRDLELTLLQKVKIFNSKTHATNETSSATTSIPHLKNTTLKRLKIGPIHSLSGDLKAPAAKYENIILLQGLEELDIHQVNWSHFSFMIDTPMLRKLTILNPLDKNLVLDGKSHIRELDIEYNLSTQDPMKILVKNFEDMSKLRMHLSMCSGLALKNISFAKKHNVSIQAFEILTLAFDHVHNLNLKYLRDTFENSCSYHLKSLGIQDITAQDAEEDHFELDLDRCTKLQTLIVSNCTWLHSLRSNSILLQLLVLTNLPNLHSTTLPNIPSYQLQQPLQSKLQSLHSKHKLRYV